MAIFHAAEEPAGAIRAMREISELIYGDCKTYLVTQGKFHPVVVGNLSQSLLAAYFGWAFAGAGKSVGLTILLFCVQPGRIAGSYGVGWFGIRVKRLPTRDGIRFAARKTVIRCIRFRLRPA